MPKKILFIDDQPDVVEVVSLRLKKLGYETIIAVSGEEGLDCVRQKCPDIIFVDLIMPGVSGEEVLVRLKNDDAFKKIPAILFTSSTERIEETAKKLQADDYLAKPFEPAQLIEKITKFIG